MIVSRRTLLQSSAAVAGATALGFGYTSAFAKAPFAATQAPGFYRTKTGTFEVTMLNDGAVDLPAASFTAPDPSQIEALLTKAGRPAKTVSLSINAYAVNTGDKLFLIDSGSGTQFGPAGGGLPANLKAAGYTPDQVDAVILTHLHGDHMGGLISAEGAVFKNAALLVNEKELAFWMDEGNMNRVPELARPTFKLLTQVNGAYKGKIQQFKEGDTVAPGILSIGTPGHTAGHTSFRVGTGNDSILVWGDITHNSTIQFSHPEFGFAFDSDAAMASETRKKVLDQATTDGLLVAGAHLDFPGFGKVAKEQAGFSYHPGFWSPKA